MLLFCLYRQDQNWYMCLVLMPCSYLQLAPLAAPLEEQQAVASDLRNQHRKHHSIQHIAINYHHSFLLIHCCHQYDHSCVVVMKQIGCLMGGAEFTKCRLLRKLYAGMQLPLLVAFVRCTAYQIPTHSRDCVLTCNYRIRNAFRSMLRQSIAYPGPVLGMSRHAYQYAGDACFMRCKCSVIVIIWACK